MKKITLAIPGLLLLLFLTQCHQKSETFQAYFWTNSEPATTNYLFINDTNRGVLPFLSTAPECNNSESKEGALYLPLPSGTYKIAVIDKEGKVKHAEKYSLLLSSGTKSINSTFDGPGKIQSVTDGNCLLAEIKF